MNRKSKFYFAIFMAFIAQSLGVAAQSKTKIEPHKIAILGLVAGNAVSDRHVVIDLILEFPTNFVKNGSEWINSKVLDSGFNRVANQLMILEEYKVIGDSKVPAKEIESRLSEIKKKMGANHWKIFLNQFSLNESAVRERIAVKIKAQNAINERLQLSQVGASDKLTPAQKEELGRKSIEEWLSQLKARYRVQMFRYPNG